MAWIAVRQQCFGEPAKAKNVPKMESKIDASRNSATENLQMERISIDRVTYQLSNSE
jgi:hypothetical protein